MKKNLLGTSENLNFLIAENSVDTESLDEKMVLMTKSVPSRGLMLSHSSSYPFPDRESPNFTVQQGFELSDDSVENINEIRSQEPIQIKMPHPKKIQVLQKWEGIVQEILTDTFIARLSDTENQIEEEAEIYLEEVDEKDKDLVTPGAVFYWHIGYNDEQSRQRFSMIKFRRLPTWKKEELDAIKRESNRVASSFGWK